MYVLNIRNKVKNESKRTQGAYIPRQIGFTVTS